MQKQVTLSIKQAQSCKYKLKIIMKMENVDWNDEEVKHLPSKVWLTCQSSSNE
jgi:hypothetical protein